MSSLAIPDPSAVDLDRARELASAIVVWAEECDDLTALEDARAKVAAIETYLRRRGEAVAAEIATADRRLEVRIGALLGPAPGAGPGRGKTSVAPDLSRHNRHEFRQMAEHQDVPEVADAINNGASRREVLGRIKSHKQQAANQALDDEISEWAESLPAPTDPEGDKRRSAVWSALIAAVNGARELAKFTPDEISDAIHSHPFPHVSEQMAADLTETVTTVAAYQKAAAQWT